MLSILVASSKGGCGKSTIATHLCAYFALAGKRSVLADADPQRSATRWAERRASHGLPSPLTLDATRRRWTERIPADTQRLIIDAPAGASVDSLDAAIERVDAIVVPVLPSVFDLDASRGFLDALAGHARIRRRRVRVGLVGNRAKPWTSASTRAFEQLRDWPEPLVATLRDAQAYALLCGLGKSLFDYHSEAVRAHQADWQGLFAWLREVNRARK